MCLFIVQKHSCWLAWFSFSCEILSWFPSWSIQRSCGSPSHLCHSLAKLLWFKLSPHCIVCKWQVIAWYDGVSHQLLTFFLWCQRVLFWLSHIVLFSSAQTESTTLFHCTMWQIRNAQLKSRSMWKTDSCLPHLIFFWKG